MELFKLTQDKERDDARIELSEQKKHEYHYLGSAKKNPHLSLWSFNKETKEIKLAEYKKDDAYDFMNMGNLQPRKVSVEKDCIYIQALNKKNVIKVLKRDYGIIL